MIADSTWAALKGRRQLKVEWNDGAHGGFESEAFKKQLLATVQQAGQGRAAISATSTRSSPRAARCIEATYYTPLAAHASMEPPAAVAEFRDGKVTVWAPTQNPQAVQEAVAAALGIDKKDVTCHVTLLGGGFGRKSKPDYARGSGGAVEAARQAGQGDLDARGRHPLRLLPHDGGGVSQGRRWTAAASRRRGCTDRRSRRSPRRLRRARASRSASSSISGSSTCRTTCRTSGPRTVRPTRTCASAGSAPSATTSTRSRRTASPTRWRRRPAATRSSSCSTCSGRARCIDLKAQGVDYSNYGAPYRQVPDRHAAAAPRAGDGGREVRLGQAEAGRRLGPRHRRAPQLQHLRRLGGRSRGRRARRRPGAAHRAGGRRRRDRESGSRARRRWKARR